MKIHNMPVVKIDVSLIDADNIKVKKELIDELKENEEMAKKYLSIPVFVSLKENGRYELLSGKTGFAIALALNQQNIPAHVKVLK